ncbi:(2Fe-2S)-binding protein [Thiomicrorhabdus sp. zzn3]|uniref:(2Fe-2S)-binding protein n=1 Tax=Thiomicrorhabdus sp. zzn3 TaxID=3039775 RepID=UPI002436CB8F|nr:(2Fe-2S)-binding protein [Thiomicrorhabdus sp. zzn3]MDG6778249.1 (2Fe-2S)-binding protein [Thiomicrorhabdus sp. zzn3]
MTVDEALNLLPEILKRNLERNLCVCNEVPKINVIKAITEGADTLEKVRAKTYASDGNGCCRRQIEDLLECLVPEHDS